MNVKRIATGVVSALPEGASFDDLDEFLFERSQVERVAKTAKSGTYGLWLRYSVPKIRGWRESLCL